MIGKDFKFSTDDIVSKGCTTEYYAIKFQFDIYTQYDIGMCIQDRVVYEQTTKCRCSQTHTHRDERRDNVHKRMHNVWQFDHLVKDKHLGTNADQTNYGRVLKVMRSRTNAHRNAALRKGSSASQSTSTGVVIARKENDRVEN